MDRKARMADVARVAGVSIATVSRVLSLPDLVSVETRTRVLDAIKVTGYRANSAARDLRRRQPRAIAILAPCIANTYFSRIIAAVQEVADAAGLAVQISDTKVERGRIGPIGSDGRVDGILLLDGGIDRTVLRAWTVPVVMVCEWIDGLDLPVIGTDNSAAVGLAVDHLAQAGHRRIAWLGGPAGNVLTGARERGFHAAMARHGLTVRPEDRLPGDFTMEIGARAAHLWAATPDRAGAVACAADEAAFGFISECDRMGIACPRDVSVVGFDDVEFSARFIPPLTTVHQPRHGFGRRAAQQLVAALKGEAPLVPGHRMLPSRFVVRGSTRAV